MLLHKYTLWPPWAAATVALLLSGVAVVPERVAALSAATSQRARAMRAGGPRDAYQRSTDRVISRRVRRAVRADPFLAAATRAVRVSSNRGIVRLRGHVRTDKERSSIVFKAGQIVGIAGVEDRVTVGNRVERAVW